MHNCSGSCRLKALIEKSTMHICNIAYITVIFHFFRYFDLHFIFSTKDPEIDRHPEKRMKAAYASFEEKMMPVIKEQNPTLRLSQLKQILRKEWIKSTENPLNQKLLNN